MSQFNSTILLLTFLALTSACRGQQRDKPDTININGYTLIFVATDSVPMTDIFIAGALGKQVTDTMGNYHQRYIYNEKYLADKFKKYFKANDSTLTLFLENGKELSFPKWDSEKDEGYNFENYLSSINYILLHIQWGEGNDWMLVNRKNGFKKRIIGEPYVSPSAKKILTVNSSELGYGDSGIELFTISGDTLKKEFEVLRNWGATGAKWLTSDKVIIEEETWDADNGISDKKVYEVMTIKR